KSTFFQYFSSKYHRFFTEERSNIFSVLCFSDSTFVIQPYSFLKLGSNISVSISSKLFSKNSKYISDYVDDNSSNLVYYSYGYRYWAKVTNTKPYFKGETATLSTGERYIYLSPDIDKNVFGSILMSSLFYWYYSIYSDGHNFSKTVIYDFPFKYVNKLIEKKLSKLFNKLMRDLDKNSKIRTAYYQTSGKI